MPCMLGLDVLEDGLCEAAVPGVGVRQAGLGARLARHQHRRCAALHQRQHLQHFNFIDTNGSIVYVPCWGRSAGRHPDTCRRTSPPPW